MICENCNNEHNGSYGSGRFCSTKCARCFSSKAKRIEINNKVSKTMKLKIAQGLRIGCVKLNPDNIIHVFCDVCGKEYITRTYNKRKRLKKTCSSNCAIKLRVKTYTENKTKKVGGYRKGSGRGKSGWYKGYWCDSSYELAFVIYNIENGINFERNKEGFEYFWNNKKHIYYPDFIINEIYYEIKGYERKQDKVKYSSLSKKLIILNKYDLKDIFSYVENKYGKDYIKLYDGNP